MSLLFHYSTTTIWLCIVHHPTVVTTTTTNVRPTIITSTTATTTTSSKTWYHQPAKTRHGSGQLEWTGLIKVGGRTVDGRGQGAGTDGRIGD